ncbi:MAG: IclR family transcriptional regulator [Streptosporangiaceae bacterium]|jgi:DNA-binding IclR family transcriptional regulator|nr:IclR family transcriptional regulator [Streptosporangiaceae bacterium]
MTAAKDARARTPPTVTGKVMAILEAFAPGDIGLTLTEVCRRAGLPLATGHRLVAELAGGGFLERQVDGTYRVGMRLWRIGVQASVASALRELALPHMEELYEGTHENVQLAVLRDGKALYLERLRGSRSVPVVTRVAGELPLHATGVGKVLLAYAPAGLREQVLTAPLSAHTPNTITDPERLRGCLAEVRRDGYAVTREEMTLGSCSVAAPVRGSGHRVVAALSIVARNRSADLRRLVPAVVTAAQALSREVAAHWDGD